MTVSITSTTSIHRSILLRAFIAVSFLCLELRRTSDTLCYVTLDLEALATFLGRDEWRIICEPQNRLVACNPEVVLHAPYPIPRKNPLQVYHALATWKVTGAGKSSPWLRVLTCAVVVGGVDC